MAATSKTCSRTIMWCVPRSGSTAITKCISAAKGTQVWFEPFCYCKLAAMEYKLQVNRKLPRDIEGNEQMYQEASKLMLDLTSSHFKPDYISYASIKRKLENIDDSSDVFVKDIVNGYVDEIRYIPNGYRHAFLIRHPLRVISSFRKSVFQHLLVQGRLKGDAASETTFDIAKHDPYLPPGFFFTELYNIWKHVWENLESHPVVIDGDDLLANPADMLPKFCRAVGLSYDEALLNWDNSFDSLKAWKTPADDMLENIFNFYSTAMQSCTFLPANQMPSRDQVTPDVIRCVDQVMPFYLKMYETRMKLD